MEFKTTKQAADEWGISPRRVQILCSQNRIQGVTKVGGVWLLPANIEKPGKLKTGIKKDIKYLNKVEDSDAKIKPTTARN